MRVRSVLLLAGAAYLVYYAVRKRVRVLARSAHTSSLYAHSHTSIAMSVCACRIWEWRAVELVRMVRRGRPRQVRRPVCGLSHVICRQNRGSASSCKQTSPVVRAASTSCCLPSSLLKICMPSAVKPPPRPADPLSYPRKVIEGCCRQGRAAACVQAGL